MSNIPLGKSDYRRNVGKEADIPVLNRYFESNPTNLEDQSALLARPGLRRLTSVGDGPIRALYSQPGSFDDTLFAVSFDELYRIDPDGTITFIGDGIFGAPTSSPSLAATARLGSTPEYLFLADGRLLWLYDATGPSWTQIAVPDDLGVISVGYISGYIIVVVAQGEGVNGRFYWIEPGETTIDALNFATAERSPDPILSVQVVGDQFWLLGTNSTEIWYPSGDATAPFQRVQGRLFDRGVWGGTAVAIKDSVMVVDTDGIVYQITGGGPQRVSNPGIEERMREAINLSTGTL